MISNRPYKTLGVEKGDEREVERVDYERNTVWLRDGNGNLVDWRPYMLAGAKGGVEVYRSEEMELRKGDRVRWTRNDPGSGARQRRDRGCGIGRKGWRQLPSRGRIGNETGRT